MTPLGLAVSNAIFLQAHTRTLNLPRRTTIGVPHPVDESLASETANAYRNVFAPARLLLLLLLLFAPLREITFPAPPCAQTHTPRTRTNRTILCDCLMLEYQVVVEAKRRAKQLRRSRPQHTHAPLPLTVPCNSACVTRVAFPSKNPSPFCRERSGIGCRGF